ncbi:histidine kinase [Tenacibaculum adriaticum]|uniref:Histidine kinase n=1 Tax=Tenacibaculum adriaticum TaxID=413713 RepID=A0A5S5DUI0_9FLAO|nr:histidine kinase [Tenacibaculum adriaticum]TYP99603.1 histidine kinase [Tenacibaculum adriaticum]
MFKKKYIFILFIVVLITISATYSINKLISEKATIVSQSIAQRSFYKKYNNLQHQFELLQKPLYEAKNVALKQSNLENVIQQLEVLREIHTSDSSRVSSWFGVIKESNIIDFDSAELSNDSIISLKKEVLLQYDSLSTQRLCNRVFKDVNNNYLWRHIAIFKTPYGTVFYGYDLDLLAVQNQFRNIDVYAVSYAYVFNLEGVCLVHPDTSYIGKDVFKMTPLQPEDTLNVKSKYSERIVTSEYLQFDVINYTKCLPLFDDTFFVSINFLKSIYEEDVNQIKKYSSFIYIIFTILLLFVFYYFALTVYVHFKEKATLEHDKANLVLENEIYQKESALLQLQQLKNQINPHFLFNSLNSLYTLIGQNNNLSKTFVIKLSKLYRYLIENPKDNIVDVKTELEFVKQYLFLQKTRFNESLHWDIEVNTHCLSEKIPYLSLQTLVENAIKHNITSKEKPLFIVVLMLDKKVVVKNSYQPKKTIQKGNQFGLKYLKDIYNFYKTPNFKFYIKDDFFCCELPYLK